MISTSNSFFNERTIVTAETIKREASSFSCFFNRLSSEGGTFRVIDASKEFPINFSSLAFSNSFNTFSLTDIKLSHSLRRSDSSHFSLNEGKSSRWMDSSFPLNQGMASPTSSVVNGKIGAIKIRVHSSSCKRAV